MRGEFDGFFIIKQIEKPWPLCSVVKLLRSGQSTQEVGSNTRLRLVFSLHFFSGIVASCLLYNRTEQRQGLSIC